MNKAFADTVRLLLTVAPEIFRSDIFAMKGGTAINLFVRDMPRLSVDIDVAYTSLMSRKCTKPMDSQRGRLSALSHTLPGTIGRCTKCSSRRLKTSRRSISLRLSA
jgi:hypothetical protein